MTDLRQAAQQALEALDKLSKLGNGDCDGNSIGNSIAQKAREKLRTALAQEHAMHDLARLGQEIEQGKRGSIALARQLCYEIAGATSEDDMDGGGYGSVDIAEILSAEVVRLQKALAQPEQQAETPPEWPLIKNILDEYGLDAIAFVAEFKAAQRPWVGLTDEDWGWVANKKGTSLDTFDQGAAWAQARLKELNT